MADLELTDDQAQSLGLEDPEPQSSGPDPVLMGGGIVDAPPGARHLSRPPVGPARSMSTAVDVMEPGGAVAPIQAAPAELSDEQAKALGLDEPEPPTTGVNPDALKFVAQHGDLGNSDRAAQVLKYAVASGMPPELVAADFDNVKKRVDASGVDWQKLAERQPSLAQFIAANPHAIPLAQEDHKNLGLLEWSLKAPWAAFMDAWHEQGTVGLQFLRAEGVKGLDPKIQARLDQEKQDGAEYGQDYGAENFLTKAVVATAKFLPYMAMDKAVRLGAAGLGAVTGAVAGAETGPGAVATGAIGGATSQFMASGVFNYAEALGPLSWELDHFRDENGHPINPAVANVAAQTGAVMSGALMSGSMGLFGNKAAAPFIESQVKKYIPVAEKAFAKAAESSVVKWLADNEVRDTISKFVGRWGLHTAMGAGMMAANSAVTAAAAEGAKAASPGVDAQYTNVADAATRAGTQAFKDLWLISAVPGVRSAMEEHGRARASAEGVARLEQAVQAAANSTTLKKSPEAFQAFTDMTAPDAKVYVPADRWVSYFQDKKLDPAKMAEAAGVKPEDLQKAIDTGGNVQFEASKFLTNLVPDGHAQGLSMDMKSEPGLETAREFQERQASQAKRLVEDEKNRGAELDAGKKAIEDFIVNQAKASKLSLPPVRATAKILSEAAATRALDMNLSMSEAARQMNFGNLLITGKDGPTPAHEEARKAFHEWMAPSASQQLKAKFESMSPENQARAVFLDKNTGLPNAAHFEDLSAHEAAQSFGDSASDQPFANVGIAGTKFINDTLDHGKGDLLYRAAAKALHDAAPELNVSKPGGDFEFRVKDQAHLDEVLKKANENLPPELRPFVLTGAIGRSREAAAEAHVELKKAAEAAGTRSPRTDAAGKAVPPKGFTGEAKDIPFGAEKVSREPHPEVAAQFSALSPEEKFNRAFVEPKTGLLNSLGWQMLDHGEDYHYAALDLRGLKDANAKFGKEGGDELIRGFGQTLAHYGGSSFDAAWLHGDEYALRHRDPYALSKMLDRIKEKLDGVFEADLPDGRIAEVTVDFWHGIARGSYEAADRNLSERKAAAKTAGQDVSPRAPGGIENHGDENRREGSLAFRREHLGRGASPQAYPGSERGRFLNQEAVAVPKPVLDAQAYIGRMKSPERKAAASAFLDYALGKTDERPVIPDDIEKHLAAEWGIVDPAGFPFADKSHGTRGDYKGPKESGGAGNMPDELRRYREDNIAHREGKYSEFDQARRVIEGDEISRYANLVKEGGKGYAREKFPASIDFRVTFKDGTTHEDSIKGLNEGHALARAASNYPDAQKVEFLRATKPEALAHVEGRPVTLEQGPLRPELEQALAHHEERIRKEPNEHAVVLAPDGSELFTATSGHPNRVMFTDAQGDSMLEHGDATLTHNHPSGSTLSADDLVLAAIANLKEIRAVRPDGQYVWRLERPESGWGYEPTIFGAREARNDFERQFRGARMTAKWRMDKIVEAAGGNPDDGEKAKGFSHEEWRKIIDEQLVQAFNEFSKTKELGWQIERTTRQAGEAVGRAGDSGSQPSDVRPGKVELEQRSLKDTEGGPRGQIRLDLSDTGRPRAFNIQVLAGDQSTFLHETAHFLSWSLHDLATSDLSTPQVRADYDTLLKFAGYDSPLDRLRAIKDGTEKEKEEKISHSFEQYVAEGKAPSRALARVFTRFKGWLTKIYQGITGIQSQYEQRYGQKLELSDEVRGVFDRMLAQEEALRQADQAVGGTGELKEAMAGMTPDQQAKYREAIVDSQAAADLETAAGAGDRRKQMGAQREAFRQQTQAALDEQPVYAAWRYLQHGNAPHGDLETGHLLLVDNNGKPFKMDRDAVAKEYGPDMAARMPPGSLSTRGGVLPDHLAPLLGFNSGDDMVRALASATPRDEAIAQGTQAKMDAAYGPELERATEAALSGVHNDKALEAAVAELRGLAKQINPAMERRARAVDVEAIRKSVERLTSQKPVGELDPANYARTERKLALEAAELWGKGEKEAAYDKREQRLLNKLLFMAERDAKRELAAARERIRNPSDEIRADLGKADPAYRDAHDAILAAAGLAPGREGQTGGLDELLAVAERDGHEVGDWTDSIRGLLADPKAWRELTVDQARDVRDAISNIRHAADESLNVTISGKKQKLDELKDALYRRTASVRPAVKKPAYGGKEPSLTERLASKYRGASGSLQELETFADMLDGGNSGPWNDLLVRSFLGPRDMEVDLIKRTLKPIKEAFDKIPKDLLKLRDQSVDVAHLLPPPKDLPAGYTRSFLWSVFLNLGNDGNIQRLVDGNKFTRENMLAAVSLLSEPELNFLQSVRDVANKTLFPELAQAYERRTGLPLNKVAATPITVNGKTFEGGYWPIRYDRDYEGSQGLAQEINDIKDLLPSRGSPTVTNSATKARTTKVNAPLDLTWGTVPQHFATVIHDIAYGDAIRQVGKVLIKPRIPDPELPSAHKTATDFIGKERAAELLPALRDIAADRLDSTAGHVTALVKGTSFLKSRLTAATIMGNLPSLARHLTDPLVAAVDTEGVPLHHIAAAYLKVTNPGSWGDFQPFLKSKELEYRHVKHEENLRQELGRMGNSEGRLEKAARVGYKLQSWMDAYVSRITFRAAYDDAKARGLGGDAAVQRADDVVRRIMPSGNIAEKPPILRTKQGWASCILFYGYASKIHNVRSRAFDRLYRAWNAEKLPELDASAPDQGSRAGAVTEVAAKMIGLGLISALGGYVAGRGPTKQEDEEKGTAASRAEWLATEVMLSPMDDGPPVIGPAIKATLLGHKTNIGSAPELMLLDHQLQKLGNLVHGKKKEDDDATWDMVANMVGMLGPLGQAQRSIPYLGRAADGREQVRGPLDLGAGFIYGSKKHQGANPLTDIQTAISGR